jgi:hypothetical protein
MPSDIIGTEILDNERHFKFIQGPLFANIILADEINRTPPKTQSALLEAMQERAITTAGQRLNSKTRFLCWQPKIQSSRKELIRFPKLNSTVLCFRSGLIIQNTKMN